MSDEKTTAYLKARGWIEITDPQSGDFGEWFDPLYIGQHDIVPDDVPNSSLIADEAMTIQLARDAAEERAAWVRFAAAGLASPQMASGPLMASHADDMLAEYRTRFALKSIESWPISKVKEHESGREAHF